METFNFCIRPGGTVDNEASREVIKFGDGYMQRRRKGINNLLRNYTVTVKVRNEQRLEVDTFFARHGGVDAFYFNDPYTGQKKKAICGKWPAKMGKTYTEFTCEFEEVV